MDNTFGPFFDLSLFRLGRGVNVAENTVSVAEHCNFATGLAGVDFSTNATLATTPHGCVAALVGKFVVEDLGLAEVVSRHPNIISKEVSDGKNILHVAVQLGDEELVGMLLGTGFYRAVDYVDKIGWSPLEYAIKQKNVKMMRVLIEAGANPRRPGLLSFAIENDEACALHLLEVGADPDDRSTLNHETCLHVAVRGAKLKLVQELVRVGANPTTVDSLGKTPANISHELGLREVADFLVENEVEWLEKQLKSPVVEYPLAEEDWSIDTAPVWGTGNLSLRVKIPNNTPAERAAQSARDKRAHKERSMNIKFEQYKRYVESGCRSRELDVEYQIEDYELWACPGKNQPGCPHPIGWHTWMENHP